jgi:hypothetical protein
MRLPITVVRVISPLALAILASTALAGELIDAQMDQITAGGLFELTADELDILTSAPVGPLQRNVIGGVGMLLEEFLSGVFSSQNSLLGDLASAGPPNANTTSSTSTPGLGINSINGTPLGINSINGTPLGINSINGTPLGINSINGTPLAIKPI